MNILTWFFGNPKRSPGVYRILNKRNGKAYIGGTGRTIETRWLEHRQHLTDGVHHNKALQEDWDHFGAGSFRFQVLETVNDPNLLLIRELHWQQTTQNDYTIRHARPNQNTLMGRQKKTAPTYVVPTKKRSLGRRRRTEAMFCPPYINVTSSMAEHEMMEWIALICFSDGEWAHPAETIVNLINDGWKHDHRPDEVEDIRIRHAAQWPLNVEAGYSLTERDFVKILATQRA